MLAILSSKKDSTDSRNFEKEIKFIPVQHKKHNVHGTEKTLNLFLRVSV